jgi:hypothetical protein
VRVPRGAAVGRGRQAEVLRHADVVICGGGHGMVAKTLLAGVPLVVVPGGGDQWEMANRVARGGSARLIRPLTVDALVDAVGGAVVAAVPEAAHRARRAAGVADPVRSVPRALALAGSWLGMLAGVRLTEFNERVVLRFGATYGASVLVDHVLTGLDGRTAAQAIEDGIEPRDVWRALCVDFDVPRDQW